MRAWTRSLRGPSAGFFSMEVATRAVSCDNCSIQAHSAASWQAARVPSIIHGSRPSLVTLTLCGMHSLLLLQIRRRHRQLPLAKLIPGLQYLYVQPQPRQAIMGGQCLQLHQQTVWHRQAGQVTRRRGHHTVELTGLYGTNPWAARLVTIVDMFGWHP